MLALRTLLAILLALEALNALLWASRIASAALAYDAVVLAMVLLRVLVSAMQAVSAWMLAGRALPALTFARFSFGLSAILLVFEIGFRLTPSNVLPGLRFPLVGAYFAYAMAGIGALRYIERSEQVR